MTGGVNVDTMQNLFNWPLWHWHFEVSSICTLKCPRCPRTEIPESLVQTQLRLDFFEKNFTFADQIKKITFCGDDGDPIYARDFLSIVNFFKQQNPSVNINIITNGSYKTPDWWKNLGNVLNENDQVHFSLDGWDQQSNEQYRVNCDWDSIMSGIHSLRENTTAFLQWDAIVFKFNQHQIDNMKSMAKELGFDSFQLTRSTKFGSKYQHYNDNDKSDSLEPDEEFISSTHRFFREVFRFNGRILDTKPAIIENTKYYNQVKEINKNKNIIPLCLIGTKGIFVNSQGYLIPCCWVANRYNHTGLSKFLIPENNISTQGIENVINAEHWNTFIEDFDTMTECKNKCSAHLVDKKYATTW